MKHTKWIIVSLILIFFSSHAMAATPLGQETDSGISVEWADIDLTDSSMSWGPGSEIPLYDPVDADHVKLVFLSNIEPMSITWKIYNPMMHKIGEDTHTPSFKQKGNWESGGKTYQWAFADQWAFTVPAFAMKGNWLLSPSYKMADGNIQQGAYQYYSVPVTVDDTVASFFSAPLYFMGFRMPVPLFWMLGIIWIPALFILICAIFTRSATGFVRVLKGARDEARSARAEWKG